MRKSFLSLALLLLMLLVVACGSNDKEVNTDNVDFKIKTLAVDTVCTLFGGNTGPRCEVDYSLKYVEGTDVEQINKIITASVFPETKDSSDINSAIHNEMKYIVDDYKATLKGVTKKSISEGTFPVACAEYQRNVKSHCDIVNSKVLVYIVSYTEKAYGESDSLENEFSFNIALNTKSVITTDDIFVQGYKDRLVGKIVAKMADKYEVKDIVGLQHKGIFLDGMPYTPNNFLIDKDNITFVYNPFEVAGRKYGIIKITLTANELKDIMKKEWYNFFGIK